MGSGNTSPENGSLNGTRRGSLQSQLTAALPAPGMPNYPKENAINFSFEKISILVTARNLKYLKFLLNSITLGNRNLICL